MVRTCSNCGSAEIDEDAARGDATCTACGTVLEESIVVTENQFQERAGGSGHTLVGQFVSAERAAANNFNGMGNQESREVTYSKGKKVIDELSSQLRINSHCMNTAFNFFKMCVSRNLTRGRNRASVVAVCLYITCRLENTAHLLLDFSDVTQINVFDLGRNLTFISRSLRINLPATDPCLYIMRFACVLDFGDKQKEVVNLATRLVQRMKRDWMSTGRRPTGICGAALLIAARSLNFNRSIGDIVRVVHISESVIRKRLDEFSQTPSGSLTIDEFSSIDLEHSEDPPAYREARRRAREDQLRKEAEQAEMMAFELGDLEASVEAALEKKRKEKFSKSPFAKLVTGDLGLEKGADEMVRKEILNTVFQAAEEQPSSSNSLEQFAAYRPSLESLGIVRNSDVPDTKPFRLPQNEVEGIDEEISDSEIDSYILTESEVAIKTDYWMKANGEVMKVIEERKREREENGEMKKPRRRGVKKSDGTSTSVLNAMEKVIQEKKLSNKVNYEMLKDLEGMSSKKDAPPAATPRRSVSGAEAGSDPGAGEGVAVDHLSKTEKIARNRNLNKSGGASLETLRNAFDLKEEIVKAPSVKIENATPTKSTPEVSITLSKSRYAKVKPIIGAKKLAALSEMKKEIITKPSEQSTSEAPEVAPEPASKPILIETSEPIPTPAEKQDSKPLLPTVKSAEKPVDAPAEIPDSKTIVPDVKPAPAVKSRYTKAKPNLKIGKPKATPATTIPAEAGSEEPAVKKPKI